MGKLVLKLPDGRSRDIPLDRERITIGRRAGNDVCLPFPGVSGEHAAVVTILDDSFLEDLNSTNGTLVNGRAIAKHFLRDHDEIDIGRQVLVYVSGDFASAPVGAASVLAAADAKGVAKDDARGTASPSPTSAALGDSVSESGGAPAGRSSERGRRVDTRPLVPEPELVAPEGPPDSAGAPTPGLATLEVLEGAGAGRVVAIDREVFVIGRVGRQVAAAMRTPDGLRLVHVEGDVPPRINGAALTEEGSLLALGDEIEIAGARLRFHSGR